MIIHHCELKKSKKNEISSALKRGKKNAHKLSGNAKAANLVKNIFLIFAAISIVISIAIMSYNLIKPQIDRLEAQNKPSQKTQPKDGTYQMIYNHEKGEFEYSTN